MKLIQKGSGWCLLFLLLLDLSGLSAQTPQQLETAPITFKEAKERGDAFFTKEVQESHPALYKRYRNWLRYNSTRKRDNSVLDNRAALTRMQMRKESLNSSKTQSNDGNWKALGPSNFTWTNAGQGGSAGQGRINDIDFHPTNSNIVYVCSPSGGLWKSTNGGSGWSVLTDDLVQPSAAAMEIHPSNPNTLYLLDGDGNGSVGFVQDIYVATTDVYKSTNGGSSWFATQVPIDNQAATKPPGFDLAVAPTDGDLVLAAIGWGVYRSADGGATWTKTFNYSIKDIQFKPGQSDVVYGYGDKFYKSIDGGLTWNAVSGPVGTVGDIAVSPNDPNLVYVVTGKSDPFAGGNLQGVWKSTNSGTSFTLTGNQQILGADDNGGGEVQSRYAISAAVNPSNSNELFVGGFNIWRSANGGVSFARVSAGDQTKPKYCGFDIHLMKFSGSTLFAATGAGLWKNTGSTSNPNWLSRNNGLIIGQYYNLGTAPFNANLMYVGAQNTGANRWKNFTDFRHMIPGDVGDCFISRSGDHIAMVAHTDGRILRTINSGSSWSVVATASGGWHGKFVSIPGSNDLYCSNGGVYKSTNNGISWTNLSPGIDAFTFAVSPSNPQIIYAYGGFYIYKTTNGGTSWSNVSSDLPVGFYVIGDIEIDNTDPNKVWVTNGAIEFGPYYCHMTTNGGASWTDISAGLPQVSANTIVHDPNSNDGLYIGTDAGVYFRQGSGTWQPFNDGLPRTIIHELEIFNVNSGQPKLRAATFGRGLWESNLYQQDCPVNASLGSVIIGAMDYQASSSLTSTQFVTGSSTVVKYRAGGSVTLFPGFSTGSSAVLTAEIGGCVFSKNALTGSYAGELEGEEANFAPEITDALEVWPNPASQEVSLNFTSAITANVSVALFDLQGKQVLPEQRINAQENAEQHLKLNLQSLPQGMYLLKVAGGSLNQVKKIQIAR